MSNNNSSSLISWEALIDQEKQKPYLQRVLQTVAEQRKNHTVYPPASQIFNALLLTPVENVKVVILGQDPYHGPGQAHGLSFSVPIGIKPPPSLRNIFKELQQDLGLNTASHGCLETWATQGVLLLNSVLTVEAKKPQSHASLGWQQLTDTLISHLNHHSESIVFMLWGGHAKKKQDLIDESKHLVLTAPHPSPLSAYRGFLGCQHFSKCNQWLKQHGRTAINWEL